MDVIEQKDQNGKDVMRLISYDGFNFPEQMTGGNPQEHLQKLDSIDFKPDDVFVVSYPKSGTHWLYEIVNMLKNGNSDFHSRMPPLIDFFPPEKLKMAPNGVYVSHLFPRLIPEKVLSNRCKVIHIYRNPKDVTVSLFNFIKKTKVGAGMKDVPFDAFVHMCIENKTPGSWWGVWMKKWTDFQRDNSDYPILMLSYEDMKKDLRGHVKQISDFLGLDSSPDLINDIAEKCEFQTMAKFKNENVPAGMSNMTSVTENHILYRKGEVGDWKNWFTVAQNELFDKALEQIEIDFDIKYVI